MTRKLKSTIKYDPRTRSKSKSNVTLATYKHKHQIDTLIKTVVREKKKLGRKMCLSKVKPLVIWLRFRFYGFLTLYGQQSERDLHHMNKASVIKILKRLMNVPGIY